jgi:hypothetical protein
MLVLAQGVGRRGSKYILDKSVKQADIALCVTGGQAKQFERLAE